MLSTALNHRLHLLFSTLFCFCIPCFPLALPLLSVLIFINWLLLPANIVMGVRKVIGNPSLYLMVLLYLVYIMGMLYTRDVKEGLNTLQIKLSFLFFPFIFSSFTDVTVKNANHYLKYFVLGSLLYALMCLGWASYRYLKPVYVDLYGVMHDLGFTYFYYTYFSLFFHPSYTAMYSLFAISCTYYLLKKEIIKSRYYLWHYAILLLIIFVILLSSKAGWIGLSFLLIVFLLLNIKSKPFLGVGALLITAGLFYFFHIKNTPDFSQRIPEKEQIKEALIGVNKENTKVTTGSEGTASRIFIWKASLEVIKENFWIGAGTGDAKQTLLSKYKERGMFNEYNVELNSHNQYFSTFIATGIAGFVVLILSLLLSAYIAYCHKHYLFLSFIALVCFNLFFESMFERQAGVLFYVFFNVIFLIFYQEKKLHSIVLIIK